jgi:hypothetical protein
MREPELVSAGTTQISSPLTLIKETSIETHDLDSVLERLERVANTYEKRLSELSKAAESLRVSQSMTILSNKTQYGNAAGRRGSSAPMVSLLAVAPPTGEPEDDANDDADTDDNNSALELAIDETAYQMRNEIL